MAEAGISMAMSSIQTADSAWNIVARLRSPTLDGHLQEGFDKLDLVIKIIAQHTNEQLPYDEREKILSKHDKMFDKLKAKEKDVNGFWTRKNPITIWTVITYVQECDKILNFTKRTSAEILRRTQNASKLLLPTPHNYVERPLPSPEDSRQIQIKSSSITSREEYLKLKHAAANWYKRSTILSSSKDKAVEESIARLADYISSAHGVLEGTQQDYANSEQPGTSIRETPSFTSLLHGTVTQLLPDELMIDGASLIDQIPLQDMLISTSEHDPRNPFCKNVHDDSNCNVIYSESMAYHAS